MMRLNLNKKYANHDKDVKELLEALEEIAVTFCAEEYAVSFDIPLRINGRLTRALGNFTYYKNEKRASRIDLARDLIELYELSEIIDVLKHELIHFCLWKLDLPHKDGNAYFEDELKRHNITSTGHYSCRRDKHIYVCPNCGELFVESRKLTEKKYFHKPCKGKGHLTYKETVKFNHKVVLEYMAG